jgi:hypothetical protein
LQYSHDPGVPIVYLGGILLLIGLTIVLYMPYRMGRLMLKREGNRSSYLVGGNWRELPALMENEIAGIDG